MTLTPFTGILSHAHTYYIFFVRLTLGVCQNTCSKVLKAAPENKRENRQMQKTESDFPLLKLGGGD